jgi:4-hydroxy-L-threonine phosphate dehydrogenase PdxA
MSQQSGEAPRLFLSCGDPAGIGPIVLLKAAERAISEQLPLRLVSCAPLEFMQKLASRICPELELLPVSHEEAHTVPPKVLGILPTPVRQRSLSADQLLANLVSRPGKATSQNGRIAWDSLEEMRNLVAAAPDRRALITAPINKESMWLAGFAWPGHTEFLETRDPGSSSILFMHSDKISVGLVTNHSPLRHTAARITPELVEERARRLCAHLAATGCSELLQVLGVNPHAGDGGALGDEEEDWLKRLVAKLAAEGLAVSGPHPADAALARGRGRFLAMYHDQGLPVFKLVAGMKGVNITLGLSHVRVSPDHGTAYDLADPFSADETSMYEAMRHALKLLEVRRA